MFEIERHIVETGRIISRRYLLQRLIKRGSACEVYQGIDQLLQRPVAVKVVPQPHIAVYKAAVRMTAQFSHPNIIGLYDLVSEPEHLYLMLEYVDGDDFAALLQRQLSPYEVASLGCELCQALMYAASSSRRLCHGDLTPAALLRDRHGLIRINNFALPTDFAYFDAWELLGGEGEGFFDEDLPWGLQSPARQANDLRAIGLLLYQLLTSRSLETTVIEPPTDGRLRFMRHVPAELCQIVAQTVIRKHPEHINTVEALHSALKSLAAALDPSAVEFAGLPARAQVETPKPKQHSSAGMGNPVGLPPLREANLPAAGLPAYAAKGVAPVAALDTAPQLPTVADISVKLMAARNAAYPQTEVEASGQKPSLALLVALGLLLFAICFILGYFMSAIFLR